jgi:DNA-binding CsgD family transcriptional regulator
VYAGSAILSHKLVGREAELARLQQILQEVRGGIGQCVLVSGEAGIGKSRLLAELVLLAPRPYHVLPVHCYEQDRAFPYAPLVDTMRLYFASNPPDAVVAALGPFAIEIVKLLPELTPALTTLQAPLELDQEAEKRRLFEALARFLTGLAQTQPLLLLVEDVQWSDEATLSFLEFFTRRLAHYSILLIMTYRPGEEPVALQQLLAQLNRRRIAHELALGPLTHVEVKTLVRTIFMLRQPMPPEFLEVISNLAEGNPFFVEEILKALAAAGEIVYVDGAWESRPMHDLHVPHSVKDAVQRRVALLSDAARQILTLAAVSGRQFSFALLHAATGMSEPVLVQLLKDLVAAQLVVEQAADQFGFRHALTREAVYTSLLRRERMMYHHTIAETLVQSQTASAARPADLAYHFFAAEVWDRALVYSELAGQQALDLYAPHEAIQHFSHALEAANHLPPAASRATLYYGRGRAHDILGTFEHANSDYRAALSAARIAGDRRLQWQALIALGLLWAAQDYRQAGDYFERALEVAREVDDATLIAHSLNRIGNWYANVDQPLTGLEYHHSALEIFQRLNDSSGLVKTLDLLGMTSQLSSRLGQAHTYYQAAIALAHDVHDRQAACSCLASLALCASSYLKNVDAPATGLANAVAAAEEAAAMAGELGWRAGEAYAHLMHAMTLGPQGDLGPALKAAHAGLAIAEEIEHRQWITAAHTILGMVYLDMLVHERAQTHLEQALASAREVGSGVWIGSTASYLALTYIGQGHSQHARKLLGEVLTSDASMVTQPQRLCWAARGEAALALGDADTALDIAERLIAAIDPPGDTVIPRLWMLRGEALIGQDRDTEAEAVLLAARDEADVQVARTWLWRILIVLGRLYQSQGRRSDAMACYATAREIVQQIAAGLADEQLHQTFAKRVAGMMPRPATASPTRVERERYGGLTAREREIAALIAQGSSNRAIADRLFVGVRTVEAHITRILTKLGFSSRTQIAAWSVEQGLVRPTED